MFHDYDNYSHHIIKGIAGFFCKHCYRPIYKEINFHLKINNDVFIRHLYHIQCPKCSYISVWDDILDPNITSSIAILNSKGYETYCCCEGHSYEHGQPYILFKDDTLLRVIENDRNDEYNSLHLLQNLKIWNLTESKYMKDKVFIKAARLDCNFAYSLKERLEALRHFVSCLPFHKSLNLE